MWDTIRSDPTHFYNNNNESWIILHACKVERCGISYSERQKDRQSSPLIRMQTDGQIDRHKSFIDMRYNTEQYSKSNSIELNRIEWRSNQ